MKARESDPSGATGMANSRGDNGITVTYGPPRRASTGPAYLIRHPVFAGLMLTGFVVVAFIVVGAPSPFVRRLWPLSLPLVIWYCFLGVKCAQRGSSACSISISTSSEQSTVRQPSRCSFFVLCSGVRVVYRRARARSSDRRRGTPTLSIHLNM